MGEPQMNMFLVMKLLPLLGQHPREVDSMPSLDDLVGQIRSLETQLAVLKAQVRQLRGESTPRSFAELEGIFAGRVSSSEEEIDAHLTSGALVSAPPPAPTY